MRSLIVAVCLSLAACAVHEPHDESFEIRGRFVMVEPPEISMYVDFQPDGVCTCASRAMVHLPRWSQCPGRWWREGELIVVVPDGDPGHWWGGSRLAIRHAHDELFLVPAQYLDLFDDGELRSRIEWECFVRCSDEEWQAAQCPQAASSAPSRGPKDLIAAWDESYINVKELLTRVRTAYPDASDDVIRAAVEQVARGPFTAASPCAAAALCQLSGLGDPLDKAAELFRADAASLTDAQWLLWIAGYSYNWIANSGLGACYFEFDDRQFADRIRVYERIGATEAAKVLREADRAFGPDGPAATLEGRQKAISDQLHARLDELGPRFWACEHEIFTRAFLFALEHPEDFRERG